MKKRNLAIIICILSVVMLLSLTACNSMFAGVDPTRYFIDIGTVEDAKTASIVVNNCIASCVRIIAQYTSSTSSATSASSGFIITEDGYVLTNRHCVIRYSSTGSDTPNNTSETPMKAKYSVVFADNIEYSAKLVAFSSTTDVAVLKIDSFLSKDKFQPLTFETQRELYYGERVYTIGNPENIGLILNELTISSPALKLNKDDKYYSIILDGNINHGNSGGPILNAYSRVSGIVFARIEGTKVEGTKNDTYGIGCAIPTSAIISFLNSIKNAKINYKTTPLTAASGAVA